MMIRYLHAMWTCMVLCPVALVAQEFTGNWYGRAETKTSHSYNTYLCEMVLTQKAGVVSGKLNYYFGSYEWTAIVAGNIFKETQTIELDPFKLITFFAQNPNGADCQMDGSLTLYTHEADTILYGQFNPYGNHRIGCPVMTVMLKKEKLHEEKRREDFEPPDRDDLDTIPVIFQPEADQSAAIQEKLLSERTFLPGPLFEVTTDSIEVHLYDNARVDNDTVTVFFNRRMIVEKQRLSLKPLIIKLGLKQGENEISMYANNIGDIPPNTALCIIYAGEDRYDVNLSSTLLTNGTVRVRKRQNEP